MAIPMRVGRRETEAKMPTAFRTWLQQFFAKRELAGPDGRALFRYRLSDEEFALLQTQLKHAALLQGPEDLVRHFGFVEAWLLYAAEWWKRCYDGDAWSWKRIFGSIGLEEPAHAVISTWVQEANRYWRLLQQLQHGRKYIGQVVLNGGVPLRLIEGADGRIASVLKMVLRRVVPVVPALTLAAIRLEVEEHASLLPQTFRQPMLFDLLAEIVFGVNTLSQQYLREPVDDPIRHLDLQVPDWRERFPLELDSESARRLMTGLLREASTAERQARHPFVVRRGLIMSDDRTVRLAVKLELASRFTASLLAQLLDSAIEALPASFDLLATAGHQTRLVGRGAIRGSEVRVEILEHSLPGTWFTESIRLAISRYGETLFELDMPGGAVPEVGLPWLFEDAEPFARLLRVGSAKLRAASTLALMPGKAWAMCEQDALEQPLASPLESLRLCRLGEGSWSISHAGECYAVVCGAATEQDELLLWHGRRHYLESQPADVFLGMPRLSRFDGEGTSLPIPHNELYWVTGNTRRCLATGGEPRGAGRLIWQQGRHIQTRLSAICLPSDAAIQYEAGHTTREGSIRLVQWPAVSIAGLSEGVRVEAWRDDKDWQLDVRANGDVPPTEICLRLHWPEGGEQVLTLPFPAKGVVLTQEDGAVLPPMKNLSTKELTGVRARMLSHEPGARWLVHLTLRCRFTRGVQDKRSLVYRTPAQGGFCEVRLFELAPMIRRMLGGVEELDARVEITFESRGQCYPGLQVTRYGYNVEKDPGQGVVRLFAAESLPSPNVLAGTTVFAIPLLAPEEPIALPALYSEGVANGAWEFNPQQRNPGTWLIYPAEGAPCQFRPMAWYIPERFAGPPAKLSDLSAALTVPIRDERMALLSLVFDKLAENPDHPDWQLLASMLAALGHLPVATLDVWVTLGRHPRAVTMAVLHLEGFADRMLDRFAEELPFQWEMTLPEDWTHSLRILKKYWQQESDRSLRGFIRDAKDKLAQLTQYYPGLGFSVNLARVQAEVLTADEQASELVWSAQVLEAAPDQMRQIRWRELFDKENGACQRLLRRSVETGLQWPTTQKEDIQQFAQSAIGNRLLSEVRHLHGDFKLLTLAYPLMLAFQLYELGAAHLLTLPATLAALREYRDFDRDWFETAYQAGLTFALIERQK